MFGKILNGVTMATLSIQFLWNSNTNLPRAHQSDIPNFNFIGHKRAEIYSKKVIRALWIKKKHLENADTSTSVNFGLVVWPWPFAKKADVSRCRLFTVMYLDTRYDVYGFITLRDITICIFYVTFDLHLWPKSFWRLSWPYYFKVESEFSILMPNRLPIIYRCLTCKKDKTLDFPFPYCMIWLGNV